MKSSHFFTFTSAALVSFISTRVYASTGEQHEGREILVLAFLAIIVLLAKFAAGIAERLKQVPVLGELILGILLGIPALAGINVFRGFTDDPFVKIFAEFSVILLLFQVGLESDIRRMSTVGSRAFLVAIVGVASPFLIGLYVVGPWLLPSSSFHTHLFLGATLTATSVGLTARVFKDLGVSKTTSSQVVLGAAVIDDVLGLIILAVVSALVTTGSVSTGTVAVLVVKAVAFLGFSIALGRFLAPTIGGALSKIQRGVGMKMAMALAFCMTYALLSTYVGLAPIVGAFAAGLLLDPVHFHRFEHPRLTDDIEEAASASLDEGTRNSLRHIADRYRERHVEDLIEGMAQWVVPIFFVVTGLQVNLSVFADPSVLTIAAGITIAAIVGKLVCGFVAGPGTDALSVGIGMIPRGEVGLIFANVGRALGVVDDRSFAAIVVMVIVTTVITPLLLPWSLRRKAPSTSLVEASS